MVPAPPAHANRFEEAADEVINPIVLGALTPRITDLNVEYFGFMWPNNAGAGLRYGATLDALGAALTDAVDAGDLGWVDRRSGGCGRLGRGVRGDERDAGRGGDGRLGCVRGRRPGRCAARVSDVGGVLVGILDGLGSGQ